MDTILVVEDEVAIGEMLGRGLRRRGYEVLVANNGDEALRMCARHPEPIEVLLCDVVTPGLGARELIRIAVGIYPGLRVLLMRVTPTSSHSGVKIPRFFSLSGSLLLLLNWFSG
jgi:two-component system, cell cycle sensor histidine kinase and response regulator CckA